MEKDLFDLSDTELEEAFRAAKSEEQSPDVGEELEETDTQEEEEETVDTEEDEDLEQPEEDSDDNEEEEDTDEEAEEDSDEEESYPDEGEEAEDEKTDEADEEVKSEPEVQTYKFKANGKEYEFTDAEMKEKFPVVFGQAMDYTRKMQAMKPWRKTIDAIEGAKLKHEDVSLMIDVLKGDKDAIGEVLKRTGVDNLELDTEQSKYVPKDYGRDEVALDIRDVIDEIKADPEYAKTSQVLGKEWDDASWNEVSKQPKLIKALHIDMKNGMYDKVQPIAEKLKLYEGGGKSDLEYYKEASRVYFAEMRRKEAQEAQMNERREADEVKQVQRERVQAVKKDGEKQAEIRQASKKRKAAAPSKKAAGRKSSVDYLDDSDEAFEEWYAKLQDQM